MRRLFAVIHVFDQAQAVRNARVAGQAGADGVFLISHLGMGWMDLLDLVPPCRSYIPYVGANFLDLSAVAAVRGAGVGLQGLWVDETYRGEKPSGMELFSGFAFKYRPQPRDFELEAVEAAKSCHVLTTSGPGTGCEADVEKVKRLRRAVGGVRVGLASGVTVDNVEEYLPYVDDYLVATGISRGDELDPDLATELADLVHS